MALCAAVLVTGAALPALLLWPWALGLSCPALRSGSAPPPPMGAGQSSRNAAAPHDQPHDLLGSRAIAHAVWGSNLRRLGIDPLACSSFQLLLGDHGTVLDRGRPAGCSGWAPPSKPGHAMAMGSAKPHSASCRVGRRFDRIHAGASPVQINNAEGGQGQACPKG